MPTVITTHDIACRRRQALPDIQSPAADIITTRSMQSERVPQRIGYRMVHATLGRDAWAAAPRVWIIGGGPSLRDFDWELLRGEVVLGCNRCYERPHVGTTIFIDGADASGFLAWAEAGRFGGSWKTYTGLKVFSQLEGKNGTLADDVYVVTRKRTAGDALDMEGGLPQTNNTGTLALQFAAALGAKDIRLLGFDLGSAGKTQEHHHGGYPWHVQQADVCEGMIPEFEKWAALLSLRGVRVTQYGESRLTCFDKRPIEDAAAELETKPERPLAVCAITPQYRHEAEEMVRTARAMGLEVVVEEYADRGNWYLNTHYKPEFMGRMLREHKRPILWLDADSRVRKYPVLFDELKADVGWVWWDWDEVGRRGIEGLELSTSILYLKPKKDVYRLLDAWQQINAERPGQHDQENLQALLEGGFKQGRLKAELLPMSYAQIYDLQRTIGEPVIEQMQASRRLGEK